MSAVAIRDDTTLTPESTSRTPTPPSSPDDPLRHAVMAVFKAMRTDFGSKFLADVSTEKDANAWKWRLYRKLDGVAPDCLVDGYERAVKERRPYMPNLVDLVETIRRVHGERQRAAEQMARVTAPKGNGLAGYVETVLAPNATSTIAGECLQLMREILARPAVSPAEAAARLDKALAAHQQLMAKAPPVIHRGEVHACAVAGCGKRGSHTHSLGAPNAVWFCAEHWRRR